MALLFQHLPHALRRDDLSGGGDRQGLDDPPELHVVMGPAEALQQGDPVRLHTHYLPGDRGVEMAEGEVDEGGNPLGHGPQRRQVQGEAPELIQKEGPGGGDVLPRLAHAGEDHPVPAAHVHLQQHGQQLPLPLFGEHVDAGEVEGAVLVRQGRVVVLQQKGPAAVVEKAAVDGDQGVVLQGAAHVEKIDDGLLAGAVLAGDQHRSPALVDLGDLGLKVADGFREAENAVVKGPLRLRAGGEANAGLTGGEGRLSGLQKKGGVDGAAGAHLPRPDGVEHSPQVPGDSPLHVLLGFRQFPPQHLQQLRHRGVQGGEKQVALLIEYHGLADLAADQRPEKEVLLPQALPAAADQKGPVKGLADALHRGGHQEGVHPQAFGGVVGKGVAQQGLKPLLPQLQQNGLHHVVLVVGADVHGEVHGLAQQAGALGDAGGGHEGDAAAEAARQLQRTQEVVHGDLDLHNGNGQVPPEHSGGVAAGDDHVVVPVEIGLGNLQAQLPVTHKQRQVHLGVFLCQIGHESLHALIGRDAQYADRQFHRRLQKCLIFKRIITNQQKFRKSFSARFKNKHFGAGKSLRN